MTACPICGKADCEATAKLIARAEKRLIEATPHYALEELQMLGMRVGSTPQDPWPKHVIIDAAFEVTEGVAEQLGLAGTPMAQWTTNQRLAAAYLSTLVKLEEQDDR